MKEILFTICGRGGSKGIKNKNIRPLCGVPLIAWTLFDAARVFEKQKYLNKTVVVDSDSDVILDTARRFCPEALIHKRQDDLAGDAIAKMDVLRKVLADIELKTGKIFDALIDLDITSPLRTAEDIEGAFEVFEKEKCDVVFSVVKARRNPYFNMIEQNASGGYQLSKPSQYVARQQAPQVFDMNASIYIYTPSAFENAVKTPTQMNFRIYQMHDYGVIDIDSEEDLEFFELIMEHGSYILSDLLRSKKNLLLDNIERKLD